MRVYRGDGSEESQWIDVLVTALRPFALAYEERDDDSHKGGPPSAVQIAGQTHRDDPWKVAYDVIEAYESGEDLIEIEPASPSPKPPYPSG